MAKGKQSAPAKSNPTPAPRAAQAPAPRVVQTNAGPNPMGAPAKASTVSSANSVGQALRIAGANGNVSKKELQKITNQFDVGADQAIRRLDKVNTALEEKGKDLKIGLGSAAVNSLVKSGNTYTSGIFNQSQFGGGKIGSTVQNYINASNPTGGYQNPQSGSSSYKPVNGAMSRAAAQSAAGLIPLQRGGAYQINSKGGYSPKVSNAAFGVPNTPIAASPNTQQPVNTGTEPITEDPITPFIPEEKPEEKMDPGSGMLSGGGMGAAGASKLGRAKSRLRQLGIYGRGTGLLGRGLQYGNALNA